MLKSFSYRGLVVATVFLVITACSFTDTSLDNTVVKSDNDQRLYRYITLPNKMRVLLVSDSATEKSAASLNINIGSRQDPEDYQGLAHFLEHMLFLGTSKYPDAGAYQAYINAHGGSHNAYTSFEHTNYFFNISPEFFDAGLDRFAQFFIAPSFTEDYVEREKNAVHSEYTSKIKDERRKGLDVFKRVINQQHPFAKLSVGNLETLSTIDKGNGSLRTQLITFYQRYYSANLMTLVLLGQEPLDQLEQMVLEKFTTVKNTDALVEPIIEPLFSAGSLPLEVQVKPEQSLRILSVVFPTEDDIKFYQQKPLHFLGNIIGHEGRGSLLSYLKKQGWAEGVSAGQGLSYDGGASFNITVQLTESGVAKRDSVIKAVFQAINRIKQSKSKEWLFTEQKILAEQQFRYQDKAKAMSYVTALSSDMHYYPPKDIVRGSYVMTSYDEKLVEHYLSYLNVNNSFISITAPNVKTTKRSHFYAADYDVQPVSDEVLARWSVSGLNPAITLPEKNTFIAKQLTLVNEPYNQDVPKLLVQKPGLKLWFKRAGKFRSPKGNLFFSLRSPVAADTVEHRALLQLLTAVMADELNEFSYSATLAGLNYSLRPHMRGLSLKISGFNDRQDLLLKKILQVVESPALDKQRFDNIRQEHIRKLENIGKQQPYQLLMDSLTELTYRNKWTEQQLLSAYRSITLPQLKAYKKLLNSSGEIEALVYGNYTPDEATQYAEQVSISLLKEPSLPAPIEITKLPATVFSFEVASDYSDASAMLYIQATDTSKARRAAMGVSAQMMRADFYTQLRTQQQLGYIVSSGAYPIMDVPALFFLVQSPVAGPEELMEAIDHYLNQRFEGLNDVDEQDYITHRNAVLSRLDQAPQSLFEQADRYWQDISQGYYQFDFRQQLIEAIKDLSFQQWRQYFTEDVINNKRRLQLYSRGKFNNQPLTTSHIIGDVQAFKAVQGSYHFD